MRRPEPHARRIGSRLPGDACALDPTWLDGASAGSAQAATDRDGHRARSRRPLEPTPTLRGPGGRATPTAAARPIPRADDRAVASRTDGEGAWTAIVQIDGRWSRDCAARSRPVHLLADRRVRRAASVRAPGGRRAGRAAPAGGAVEHLGRARRAADPQALPAAGAGREPGPRGQRLPDRCRLRRHAGRGGRDDLCGRWRRGRRGRDAPGLVPSSGDALGRDAAAPSPATREAASGIAATVGGLTAAMHAALASRPDHPAFPAARRRSPRRPAGGRRPSASWRRRSTRGRRRPPSTGWSSWRPR